MTSLLTQTSEAYLRFRQPLTNILNQASDQRSCPVVKDHDWIDTGIFRVLDNEPSGRAFLQSLFNNSEGEVGLTPAQFFDALKSKRRKKHLRSILDEYLHVAPRNHPTLPGPSSLSILDDFDIYAGDGHFHAAATHDARDYKGRKTAVGHLYTLNLRNFTCNHLALGNRKETKRWKKTEKNHDITLLKSLDKNQLRQGAPKGRKVLYVWDKACIDFAQWFKWKQAGGIYFLSLEKRNMRPISPAPLRFDRVDPVNSGVIKDELAGYGGGVMLRRVTYSCPQSGRELTFLSNLTSPAYPPGLIAQLYRMRWDIEKIFDVFKNKLGETKAWGSTETAREMQAIFITLTHNLLTSFEEVIGKNEGITNITNKQRALARLDRSREEAQHLGKTVPRLYENWQRIKQTGVTFIRWLRAQIFKSTSWAQSLCLLRRTYSTFKA